MNQPCPPHWTFAARAAYFGELMCPFCDHRNPTDAKFCNDCAWPLHLRPCKRCNAVNDQAATHCHNCGGEFTDSPNTFQPLPDLPSAGVAPSRAAMGGETATIATRQPPFVVDAAQTAKRSPRRAHVLLAAITTILIAGAYTVHQRNSMAPNALDLALEPAVAGVPDPDATPAVPPTLQAHETEPDATVALPATDGTDAQVVAEDSASSTLREPASPEDNDTAANGMNAPRDLPPSATQRASAQQPPAAQRKTVTRATRARTSTPVGVPVAETRKKRRLDRWQAMEASLDNCSGDFFERVVCDQRVRLRFCEGQWGKVAQCASGVINEHGQ